VAYILYDMAKSEVLACDGCGQAASAEHIARRLRRLEWATRFRPVHIQVLLLGAAMPERSDELIYSPDGAFRGEAEQVLKAAAIAVQNREKEAVQSEFQRAGMFVAHVLECPVELPGDHGATLETLLERRMPAVLARIRRSLKPKKLAPISSALDPFLERLSAESQCDVLLKNGRAFDLAHDDHLELSQRLQDALAARRSV
jgi:hypothetical protein